MIVKDNFLAKKDFKKIKDLLMGSELPWFFNNGVSFSKDGNHQFIHNFYKDANSSKYLQVLFPLFKKLKIVALIRIKANNLTVTDKIKEHMEHVDTMDSSKSKNAIFYINTNNGYTYFKNKKIFSKENRICIFDNSITHGGSTCTDQSRRILINFNYFTDNLTNKKGETNDTKSICKKMLTKKEEV